jgi:tRNA G18 (ribose-2'-O)-methylase SpoU
VQEKTLRTTMNAHQFVPWEWHQRTSDVMDMLASGRYSLDEAAPASADGVSAAANPPLPVVALETVEGQPSIYAYTFPSRSAGGCALLLGNERHGIEADLLKVCRVCRVRRVRVGVALSSAFFLVVACIAHVRVR